MIAGRTGVHVLDPGQRYKESLPWPRFGKETGNLNRILDALDSVFPGKKIESIIVTHRHFDHAELAPGVQEALGKKQGSTPPIRAHPLERKRAGTGYVNAAFETVFRRAGYNKWKLEDVKDGDKLEGTGFMIRHMPGHTRGTIGLVDEKQKVMITSYNPQHMTSAYTRVFYRVLDSKPEKRQRYRTIPKGYTIYSTHPDI